jgi:hypothetical protein
MNVVACPEHTTCFAVCCHDYTAINNNSVRNVLHVIQKIQPWGHYRACTPRFSLPLHVRLSKENNCFLRTMSQWNRLRQPVVLNHSVEELKAAVSSTISEFIKKCRRTHNDLQYIYNVHSTKDLQSYVHTRPASIIKYK